MSYITNKESRVSTLNSTSALLTATSAFTGTAELVEAYSTIKITISSDVDSAGTGVVVQFGPDGTNWDITYSSTYINTTPFTKTYSVAERYFRVVYTNNPTNDQTEFRLQTIMSFTPPSTTVGTTDSAGRILTANTQTVLNISHIGKKSMLVTDLIAGTGNSGYVLNESIVNATTTSGGDGVITQSIYYAPYQLGKTTTATISGILNGNSNDATVTTEMGYYDNNNGIFIRYNAALSLNIRTSTSGIPVTTSVSQSTWNIDKMDGAGTSGILLDPTKFQVFVFELDWNGKLRAGVIIGGNTYYMHEFDLTGTLTTNFMARASLPLRWSISSSNAAGRIAQGYGAVSITGGFNALGRAFAVGNGITPINVAGTELPLVAIRLGSGLIRDRVQVLGFSMLTVSPASILTRLRLFPTPAIDPLTGGAYGALSAFSAIEVRIATAINTTGSIILKESYSVNNYLNENLRNETEIYLGANVAGNISDVIVLTAVCVTGSGQAVGSINWVEY